MLLSPRQHHGSVSQSLGRALAGFASVVVSILAPSSTASVTKPPNQKDDRGLSSQSPIKALSNTEIVKYQINRCSTNCSLLAPIFSPQSQCLHPRPTTRASHHFITSFHAARPPLIRSSHHQLVVIHHRRPSTSRHSNKPIHARQPTHSSQTMSSATRTQSRKQDHKVCTKDKQHNNASENRKRRQQQTPVTAFSTVICRLRSPLTIH